MFGGSRINRGADVKLNRRCPLRLHTSQIRIIHRAISPTSGPIPAYLPGFVLEHVQMNHYRVVKIDYDGKLSRHRGFVCDNDDDAIVWAKQLVDEAPVELWSGARFVTRLEPRSNTKPQ